MTVRRLRPFPHVIPEVWATGLTVETPTENQLFNNNATITVSGVVTSPLHLLLEYDRKIRITYNGRSPGAQWVLPDPDTGVYTHTMSAVIGAPTIWVDAYYDDDGFETVERTIQVGAF